MPFSFREPPQLTLHGYSPQSPADIFHRVHAGAKPSALHGDFLLVAEGHDAATGQPLVVFISTVVAAVPYFFIPTPAGCVHGPNVLQCCQRAKLPWAWNWDAVAQLALFDHVLGDVSLHASIQRVPAASVVVVLGGKVTVNTEPFWTELYRDQRYAGKVQDAASVLLGILDDIPAEQAVALSLSAGYDSRVLLAALTHQRRHVVTACMGDEQSTDARIAAELAAVVRAPFQRVPLTADDYPRAARETLIATSGEKVFLHWHTAIYSQRVAFAPDVLHLAGSNGEFARSTLFDKGFVARALDALRVHAWRPWVVRQHRVAGWIAPGVVSTLDPKSPFAAALNPERMVAGVVPGTYRFGDGLDVFYACQRVRNFIGLGVALYRSRYHTMSPFLDVRYIRYAASLPRQAKLANRLPRALVQQLQPALLDFPTDETGTPMRANPSWLYFRQHGSIRAYQKYREAQQLDQVRAWALAGFALLGGSTQQLATTPTLQAQVMQWNVAITLGAWQDVLTAEGIAT